MKNNFKETPVVRQFHFCEVKGFVDKFRELYANDDLCQNGKFNCLYESKLLRNLEFSSISKCDYV